MSFKNHCLPIDVDRIYDIGRICCINTNIINFINKIKDDDIDTSNITLISIMNSLKGIIYGEIGVAKLPNFLLNNLKISNNLFRTYNTRNFFLSTTDIYKYTMEYLLELNLTYFLRHPVLAINDGEVIYIYNDIENNKAYDTKKHLAEGNYIILSHANNTIFSFYGYLYKDSINLKIGDKVTKGQKIADVGNTGNSIVPHLHFEILELQNNNSPTFSLYKYTPLDIKNKSNKEIKNILSQKLIENDSGQLHDKCFIT